MSNFIVVECKADTKEQIVAGLEALGVPSDKIETSESEKIEITGYSSSETAWANVAVRKDILRKHTGGCPHDIGFEKLEAGGYKMHMSDMDKSWWKVKQPVFQQAAVTEKVVTEAQRIGYTISKIKEGNDIIVKLARTY